MPRKPSHRGFTALEVLLVTAALAAAASGLLGFGRSAPRREVQATGEASELRKLATEHYRSTGRCPTVRSMMAAHALLHPPLDPWGTEYWFACREGQVSVISDGADRAPFTADDVGDPALRPDLGPRMQSGPRWRGAS